MDFRIRSYSPIFQNTFNIIAKVEYSWPMKKN